MEKASYGREGRSADMIEKQDIERACEEGVQAQSRPAWSSEYDLSSTGTTHHMREG